MKRPGAGQGPPWNTGNGKLVTPTGRFTTTPKAPSSLCARISTTERAKFGSMRLGWATKNDPASDMAICTLERLATGLFYHVVGYRFQGTNGHLGVFGLLPGRAS